MRILEKNLRGNVITAGAERGGWGSPEMPTERKSFAGLDLQLAGWNIVLMPPPRRVIYLGMPFPRCHATRHAIPRQTVRPHTSAFFAVSGFTCGRDGELLCAPDTADHADTLPV